MEERESLGSLPDPEPPAEPSTSEVERWRRLKAAFVDMVERERTAREAALDEIAAFDPDAAAEARSLLRRFDEATTTLLRHGPRPAHEALEEAPDLTGRTVGGYRVTAARGRGGMGAVYEAVREEDGKRVAIKLLRWRGDRSEVAARMRAERRILAGLEHDNIARLIDGGVTEEGLPYFTLELVDGSPIVRYCADHRIGERERLELFCTVCAAVEYAHQRLVIHCDIKPANLLVTAEGVPKLLDFGIARLRRPEEATAEAAEPTASGGLTPEYASPEQVRGLPVTTATDVYALGLLLYELLTGQRAQRLEQVTPQEIERVVCDSGPHRPSLAVAPELRRKLRGDLDAIVLRALAKSPAGRYGSARELADDVRRHLESRPVEARSSPTAAGTVYRAGRFVLRHRAAFAAGFLVVASLVAGTVAALRQAGRAERRFADVKRLAGSFLFEIHDAIRELPGATTARRLIVAKSLEYLDRLSREAKGDLDLTRELAVAYQRVGDVQGYTANANLGDTPGAVASFRKAVALAEELVESAPADPGFRLTLGIALEKLGTTLSATGDRFGAAQALGRSGQILERLAAERPRDGDVAHALHVVLLRQGQQRQQQGDADGALTHYVAAERVDDAFLAAVPGDRRALRDKSVAVSYAASIEADRDPERGLRLYESLLPSAIELAAADPANAELQRDLLVGHEDVAQALTKLGRYDEALAHHGRALVIAEALVTSDPANLQALQDLSVRHAQIGDVRLAKGDLSEALVSYRRSLEIDARVAARDPTNAKAALYLAWSHLNVADTLGKRRRPEETAERLDQLRRAVSVLTPFAERDPANARIRDVLADSLSGLGEALLEPVAAGQPCPAEARDALARALSLRDATELQPGEEKQERDRLAARLSGCDPSPSPPPAGSRL